MHSYFPEPDEGSKHHYGKYTNLTLRYKYATGYSIDLEPKGIFASIFASKGSDILSWIDEGSDVKTVNVVDVYYKQQTSSQNSSAVESTHITFAFDGVIYNIRTSSNLDGARQKVDDYARYLFDKIFIVDSDSLK